MKRQHVRQPPIADDRQEFGSSRAIWTIALAIALAESAVYLVAFSKNIASSISDPDDAMRLVQVRELLHGKGWYDQLTIRINPPQGLYMHWSRLVDGAEAGMIWLFQLLMSNPAAELLGREVWPLLWILPAAAAALFFARNLGGRYSVVICAALLVIDILVFRQFRPGRLDHHNIQITLAMIAVAMASWPELSWKKATLAGLASGLGLAVGLEALPILAAVGITFAARLSFFNQRLAALYYGASLAISTAGFYLLQTPPSRWHLPFCDALAINLVAGIVILGAGLAAIAAMPRPRTYYIVLLTLLGGAVYFGIHPACMTGGFGDMDPRLRSIWLDMDSETLPITALFKYSAALAAHPLAMMVELALAGVILWRTHRWSNSSLLVALLCLIIIPAAIRYAKFQDYLLWVGLPAFSAAASLELAKFGVSRLVALLASIVFAPASIAVAVQALAAKSDDHANLLAFPADCGNLAGYESLSRLKPGLVLSDIAIGPQILASTNHSVTGAPYHRLSTQIVRVYDAQRAAPQNAERIVRGMDAAYLVDCKGLPDVGHGLFHDLRHGATFSWLARVSRPGDAIQIWQVLDGATESR